MKKIIVLCLFFLNAFLYAGDYSNFAELTQKLKNLSDNNPNLVKMQSQGKTIDGRDIWCVTVTKGDDAAKPAVLVVAGVEGSDLVAGEMALNFVQSLVENYGQVDSVTQLVDKTTFYVFPRVNPDASEAYWNNVKYERTYNNRPIDLDYDGVENEDGFDDLNGDGLITKMRITDPEGEWLADKENPELMRKADASKGEAGIYKVLTEGFDNDKDGKFNEDEIGGVNFNQNFAFNYEFFIPGAGVHQISETESRAVADFCFSHPNISLVFTFSKNENLIHPWKAGKKEPAGENGAKRIIKSVMENDASYFEYLSNSFKKITGITEAPESEKTNGAFNEWVYYHFGRWSVSTPAWVVPTKKVAEDASQNGKVKNTEKKDDPIKVERNSFKWLSESGQIGKFVQWTMVDHPDFPDRKVEVGGFAPYTLINPPVDSLGVLSDRFNKFLYWLPMQMPRISMETPKVEKLGNYVYRISVHVRNDGYLPINSEIGTKIQWAGKVKIEIGLDKGQHLNSGRKIELVNIIAGSGGIHKSSWIVTGKKGEVTITAGSPMAGFVSKPVELK